MEEEDYAADEQANTAGKEADGAASSSETEAPRSATSAASARSNMDSTKSSSSASYHDDPMEEEDDPTNEEANTTDVAASSSETEVPRSETSAASTRNSDSMKSSSIPGAGPPRDTNERTFASPNQLLHDLHDARLRRRSSGPVPPVVSEPQPTSTLTTLMTSWGDDNMVVNERAASGTNIALKMAESNYAGVCSALAIATQVAAAAPSSGSYGPGNQFAWKPEVMVSVPALALSSSSQPTLSLKATSETQSDTKMEATKTPAPGAVIVPAPKTAESNSSDIDGAQAGASSTVAIATTSPVFTAPTKKKPSKTTRMKTYHKKKVATRALAIGNGSRISSRIRKQSVLYDPDDPSKGSGYESQKKNKEPIPTAAIVTPSKKKKEVTFANATVTRTMATEPSPDTVQGPTESPEEEIDLPDFEEEGQNDNKLHNVSDSTNQGPTDLDKDKGLSPQLDDAAGLFDRPFMIKQPEEVSIYTENRSVLAPEAMTTMSKKNKDKNKRLPHIATLVDGSELAQEGGRCKKFQK